MVKSLLFDVDVEFTASANTDKLIPMCFFEDIFEHMTFHPNLICNPPKLEKTFSLLTKCAFIQFSRTPA